ncbi:MAG: hypothetical protein GY861_14460 [bacterium]|nr:hypothetical protein [bacterium]
MKTDINEIEVNGVEYVRKDSIKTNSPAESMDGMKYCIVRTYSAGVFAGYIASRNGKEATIKKARRIWYWDGASSLSQLAMEGTNKPDSCKFPCEVDEIELTEVVEVLCCTEKAKKSITGVKVWEQ